MDFCKTLVVYYTRLHKAAILKGTNTDTIPTLISVGVEKVRLAHH